MTGVTLPEPRLSFPTHRFVKRGNQLIEEPFQLVVPRDGRLPLCLSVTLDGTRIAWEFCAGCGLHVARCIHDVPIEPAYITRMRTGVMPEFSYAPRPQTGVHRSERSEGRTQFSGSGGSATISISDLVTPEVVAKVKAAREARDADAD